MLLGKDPNSQFKKRLIVQLSILLGMVVIFSTFFFLFKANIKHQISIIKTSKDYIRNLSASAENLSLLIQDWQKIKDYRDDVDKIVPKKDDLVGLSKKIERLSTSYNVSVNFAFGMEEDSKGRSDLGSIGFTLTMRGNYSNAIDFLKFLEEEFKLMKIKSVDISDNGTGSKLIIKGDFLFAK